MNWFKRLKARLKLEHTIYYKGVIAGRQLMASERFEIPEEATSGSLKQVFISGLASGAKHHKFLAKEEVKAKAKKLD